MSEYLYDSMDDRMDYIPDDELFDQIWKETEYEKHGALSSGDQLNDTRIRREYPLETFLNDEEVEALIEKIHAGDHAKHAEERLGAEDPALSQLIADAQKARDTLVGTNLRLAMWVARATMGFHKERRLSSGERGVRGIFIGDLAKLKSWDLDYGDRLQLASLGVLRAIDNHKNTVSFTRHARSVAENEIARVVGEPQSPLNVSSNKMAEIRNLRRRRDHIEDATGTTPSHEELADFLDTTPWQIAELEQIEVAKQQLSFEVLSGHILAKNMALDEDDEQLELADILPDFGADMSVEEEVMVEDTAKQLDDLLAPLPERTQTMIDMHYGLTDGNEMTLRAIAREFGLSGVRVRQIIIQGLSQIRHNQYKARQNKVNIQDLHVASTNDAQYGLRPEIALETDDDVALGLKRSRAYGGKRATRSVEVPRKVSYTLPELRDLHQADAS
jgi:RNA polymerase sigma factor (sigma-70 family)